ncbi:MAG: HIT family protein [Geothrix sp.]|nr:HIT family protein [Geothrix sp.]
MNEPASTGSRDCRFCGDLASPVIASNALAFAIRDAFPVTPLHALVIPHRHVEDFFGLTAEEREACAELIHRLRGDILEADPEVQGFSIGLNAGRVAGQTIFHSHIHLIPRRKGDVQDPRGGVRAVIAGQGHHFQEVCPFGRDPERL